VAPSISDYGADPTGAADSNPALQSAALVEQLLNEEEGPSSPTAYPDSRGYLTIARGVCIDKRVTGCGLSARAIQAANEDKTEDAVRIAMRFPNWPLHNPVQQAVLVSMAFQMGESPLYWPAFNAALEARDYAAAEAAGLDSEWAKTETPRRAKREMAMLRSGSWVAHAP
jgi:GH24 family phage-related lysozyme (muramidase)